MGGDQERQPAVERERKFKIDLERVPSRYEMASLPRRHIEQGYLTPAGANREVRIRRVSMQVKPGRIDHRLTVKDGSGQERAEVEVVLAPAAFEALWPLTERARIQKVRHDLPLEPGVVVELDVFEGHLAGMAMAEVEFASRQAATRFRPPEWFGAEVTDDPRYGNRSLAEDGSPESQGAAGATGSAPAGRS